MMGHNLLSTEVVLLLKLGENEVVFQSNHQSKIINQIW